MVIVIPNHLMLGSVPLKGGVRPKFVLFKQKDGANRCGNSSKETSEEALQSASGAVQLPEFCVEKRDSR
jgi:hypothetical protein